jgi:hypothetical protein
MTAKRPMHLFFDPTPLFHDTGHPTINNDRNEATPGTAPATHQIGYACQHFIVPWFAHDPASHTIPE